MEAEEDQAAAMEREEEERMAAERARLHESIEMSGGGDDGEISMISRGITVSGPIPSFVCALRVSA